MSIKHFYYICIIGVTFLAGILFLLLAKKIEKPNDRKGIVFIAFGMFSWTFTVFYKLFDPPIPSLFLTDIDRFFSVFTNIFFIIALPFFSTVFVKFRAFFSFFRKTEHWVNKVLIFFAFITVLFAVINRNVESEFGKNIIIAIDSFFSFLSIGLISYAVYRSITLIWNDLLIKAFFGIALFVFPSSQILLPLTLIFPDQFSSFYFPALILLLIGIVFFNFSVIVYYFIYNIGEENELQSLSQNDNNTQLEIKLVKIGFDKGKKLFFIEIDFKEGNKFYQDRVENRKILLPYSNWILFSIAKKLNIKLFNQDISLAKFRMVEYWNKNSEIKINQEILFINDNGLFEFNLDANSIEIINSKHLDSKHIITQVIQKSSSNFSELFPEKQSNKLEAKDLFDLMNSAE